MQLDDAVELFLDALLAEGRSEHTVRSYRTCLRSLMHFLGDVALVEVTATVLRNYLKEARQRREKHVTNPHRRVIQEPLSRESIRTYYRYIRAFLNWCFAEGLIEENPTERVKMPPKSQHAPKEVSEEDFWKLVRAAGGSGKLPERDRAMILVLADTGARVGGIVGLTMDRLHLAEGLIEVVEKGDKSRLIPILPVSVEALRQWLAMRPTDPGVPYVFTSYSGEALTPSGFYQVFKRLAKRIGVTGRWNPHAFRHYFGHKWVASEGDISTLSEVLGHSQIHVTKEYYLRYDTDTIRQEHLEHSPLAGEEDLLPEG